MTTGAGCGAGAGAGAGAGVVIVVVDGAGLGEVVSDPELDECAGGSGTSFGTGRTPSGATWVDDCRTATGRVELWWWPENAARAYPAPAALSANETNAIHHRSRRARRSARSRSIDGEFP